MAGRSKKAQGKPVNAIVASRSNNTSQRAAALCPVSIEESQIHRAKNSPNIVRSSLLKYLRDDFAYKLNWTHPTTEQVFPHNYIRETLEEYRVNNPVYYRNLWALWTSQATRETISQRFHLSASTVRRRWDRAINTILLMMVFPSLAPKNFKLYDHTL